MTRLGLPFLFLLLALPALAGTIRGRVTGATDVRVIASNLGGVPIAAQSVAPDGRYELTVPPGKFRVHTEPNFFGGSHSMQAWRGIDCPTQCDKLGEPIEVAEGQVVENIDFTLRAKGGRVAGVVMHGASKAPVANATVEFTSVDDAMRRYVFNAGPNGAFDASVPTGTYSVVAFGDRFATSDVVQMTIGDKADQKLDFALKRLAAIRGTVRAGGQPIAGVRVESAGPKRASATTDANGVYTIYDAPGQYAIAVADPGVVRSEKSVTAAFETDLTADFEVTQRGSLPGRVIDAATGAPIPGATVSVYGLATLTTDAEGRFLFAPDRQPAQVTEVTVVARGYARLTQEYDGLTVAPGAQVQPLEYRLTRRP